jgi:hypothetical protein
MRGECALAISCTALLLGCRASAPAAAGPTISQPAAPHAVAAPPVVDPVPRSLEAELDAHAVGFDDFGRLDLYTWTTPAQIEALRAGGPLLVADAQSGDGPSPYHRVLAAMVEERRPGHELAALLRQTPSLTRCRYAWPSPFATVLGMGPKTYGNALVRIRLRPQAVIARLDPTADPPWTLRDGEGRSVQPAELLAEPERLGAVFHLRVDDEPLIKFREYVVCNAAMVEGWSVGTAEIRDRVDAERRLVLALREGPFAALPEAQTRWRAWPQWIDAAASTTWPSRWHRALAFDNVRYRPTPAALDTLARALADYDPTLPELVDLPVVSIEEPTSPQASR